MMPLRAAAPPVAIPSWLLAPFAMLLLAMALLPTLLPHFWERHYAKVALALGAVPALWLALVAGDWHSLQHAAAEYTSFIALIGSLFVISGGIQITVRGEATPWRNAAFLALGAVLSNLVGTTGASMLLIRPWISMNKYRITGFHVVFFIFVVANCGGALTPIGDPPLFLGYLRGVPFGWMLEHAWAPWIAVNAMLIGLFLILDWRNFKRAPKPVREEQTRQERFALRGWLQVVLLLGVLVCVFLPARLQEMRWLGILSVPAVAMSALALVAFKLTPPQRHEANDFSFGPLREVAWLFVGIFLTMIPALQTLQQSGLKFDAPLIAYFGAGSLSAFLDNAPTYLAFLASAMGSAGLNVDQPAEVLTFAQGQAPLLLAIALGAVFFGAGTYVGNGPNFMIKAIAEQHSVRTPTFLGYMLRFSLPILLPILALVGWWFLGR